MRESEARLARAQQITHLGSWDLDLRKNELTWSDEVYRIFGLQPQEFGATYETFLERVHPEDRAAVDAAYSGSVQEGKDSYEIEHRVIRPATGEIRWVHEKCQHTRDAAGKIIRSMGMVLDITERKIAEEALRRARDELQQRVDERTAELSLTVATLRERSEQLRLLASELTMAEQRERQRLAQVLHDGLQQILVGAKYRLALIERSNDTKHIASEVADIIDDAIETSRSLTAELSPPILHQSGLLAALEWLIRWMQHKHGFDVDLMAEEKIHLLQEELAVFLFQAVRELLFNVIKHAGAKAARIQVIQLDGQIQIVVEDKGSGFDQTQLRAVGGRTGGFGLFSLSERLSMLGGRMAIDSSPGGGSRISLIVPLTGAESEVTAPSTDRHAKVSATISSAGSEVACVESKLRIALVDDHKIMRQGLAGLLRAEPDMEIVGEASDGESAVQLIREVKPDVVLMDVSMPGMNGIQATQVIHSELPEVRIIGLSMFQEGEQAAAMREAGAVDYVTKSGPAEAVIVAIRACVRRELPPARQAAMS